MIDAFAEVTHDAQFIHVDPERAAATPFGGTVAHGFLTLSLLSAMANDALPRRDEGGMGVNYGFDRVRFLAPVRAGANVRGRFRVVERTPRGAGGMLTRYIVAVDIQGETKPALAADWLILTIKDPSNWAT